MKYVGWLLLVLVVGCAQEDPVLKMMRQIEQSVDRDVAAAESRQEYICRQYGNNTLECIQARQEVINALDRGSMRLGGAIAAGQGYSDRRQQMLNNRPVYQPAPAPQICSGGVDAFGRLCLP